MVGEALKLLPNTIPGALESPRICDLVKQVGKASVALLVEAEVIRASRLINTGGNLKDGQSAEIAKELIETYPSENVADFRACFHRALSLRKYGEVIRFDLPTIAGWLARYMDEKYEELEADLYRQKDDHYTGPKRLAFESFGKFPDVGKEGFIFFDKEKGNAYIWDSEQLDYKPALNIWDEFLRTHEFVAEKIPPMTRGQVLRNGQEEPPRRASTGAGSMNEEEAAAWYRAKYPTATDVQIQNLIYTGKL